MPIPDAQAGTEPVAATDGRQCSTCQRGQWSDKGFLRFCPEDFRLHHPLEPACRNYVTLDFKPWGNK